MSDVRLIILPLVGQFFCYSLMTLILPAILFGYKLTRFCLAARFLIYQLIGNFYLMNLVFILELLHICNPFTLWGVTIVVVVGLMLKKKETNLYTVLDSLMEYLRRHLTGVIGRRSVRSKIGDFFLGLLKDALGWMKRYVLPHIVEWIVLAAFLVYFFYIRGTTYFVHYGYYYSDMMVHNYWINGLSEGKLFIAGIYPYGYHNIIYAMHAMFGMETVNLLRLFGLVQFTYVILGLYAFLRAVGKTWFAPMVGMIAVCGLNVFRGEVLERFSSPLPQEFGYIFMLPSLYFAILFFKERAAELKAAKEKKKPREKEEEEEEKKRRKRSRFRPVRRKKAAGFPVMRPPKGELPEKVYIGTDGLFFFCNRAEFPRFLNKNPGEIYPAEAYLEDGTLKPEYAPVPRDEEEDYPVSFSEEDYPVTVGEEDYPIKQWEKDYPVTGEGEDYPLTAGDGDYPLAAGEEDFPVYYTDGEEDYPTRFDAAEEDFPVRYADGEDYPAYYSGEAEGEEDYPAYYEGAEGQDDYPAYFEDDGESPIYYEEDEDGYRYYYDENGDYPVVFEDEEETLSDDWESIIKEILKPRPRELTEEEKRKLERLKRWHASPIYKLFQKTKPFRMKVKAWIDKKKVHPIRRFVFWIRNMPVSTQCLFFYAMAFSMTLAAHFYVTIAAGLGCIALALTWCLKFFRWRYLKSVLLAVLAAFLFALYPMGIAYIGGTPLQGSIGWAMNVMKGTENDEQSGTMDIDGISYAYSLADGMTEQEFIQWIQEVVAKNGSLEGIEGLEGFSPEEEKVPETVTEKIEAHEKNLRSVLEGAVFLDDGGLFGFSYVELLYALLGAGLVLGILAAIKDREYGKTVFSMALFTGLLLFVFVMAEFGLPRLMDENRNREFFAFVFAVSIGLSFDAALYLFLGWKKTRLVMQIASLAVFAGSVYLLYSGGKFRLDPVIVESLQSNGAMTSTLTIIDEYPKFHWTVVTANDEIRMVEEYGRHTEVITFLRAMEDYDANSSEMFIPTDYVFFYIEKVPMEFGDEEYEEAGQPVSQKGAERSLPKGNRVSEVYYGEPRWITMSHMYYWAKRFMELFPNEMEVLYEDDQFVCYKIQQNTYSLYNFAINYGYNAKSSSDHRRRRSEG